MNFAFFKIPILKIIVLWPGIRGCPVAGHILASASKWHQDYVTGTDYPKQIQCVQALNCKNNLPLFECVFIRNQSFCCIHFGCEYFKKSLIFVLSACFVLLVWLKWYNYLFIVVVKAKVERILSLQLTQYRALPTEW